MTRTYRRFALDLGVSIAFLLAAASPARAGDVEVKLDAGAGFSIKNNTGAMERLRVDEATGNVSRNGALFVHTTGTSNTFVGAGAGNLSTSGLGGNSAFGADALASNTTGYFNAAVGSGALRANTSGYFNSAVGAYALYFNTTGYLNSGVGTYALLLNTTGFLNSAFGTNALRSNTTGFVNSAFGTNALQSNTSGRYNSAVGYGALGSNTIGYANSAFGTDALHSNSSGNYNSAVGYAALHSNSTGTGNAAVGHEALLTNSTGFFNVALGSHALRANTTGYDNAAVGRAALQANSAGRWNSAVGEGALYSNTTANLNVGVGYRALSSNTTGHRNTGVGSFALSSNTTGARNVAVGYRAGTYQTTGSDDIYLAHTGVAAESGRIRIGTSGTHTATYVAGIRGATTGFANAIPVLVDSAGQLGTVSSSRSVKKDIRDMGDASARLLELRPVTFRYKQAQSLPGGREVPPEYGLIAEEVAEVFPDLVVYDEVGQPFSVKYHELAPMLLNEMKRDHQVIAEQQRANAEQQLRIEHQAALIEARRQEYEMQIAALTTRLARLEAQRAPH